MEIKKSNYNGCFLNIFVSDFDLMFTSSDNQSKQTIYYKKTRL